MTDHTAPKASTLETVGNTPLVELHAAPAEVPVYAKLESFNPGGSVKDRIGKHILEGMLERGVVDRGDAIVEPTAGNTGIGMALAARQLGLDPVFVVPRGFSEEKLTLMRALGADIVHTPHDEGMLGAIEKAEELVADRDDAAVPQQFSNPLNVDAHYQHTGQEILDALDGEVGSVVAGVGSGGTLMGVAKAVRERQPAARVIAVEPKGSIYGTLLGEERAEGDYKTEGIGTSDPELAELIDPEVLDEIVAIEDRRAHEEVQRLAAEEGHLVGSSAGAASVAARREAEAIAAGEVDAPVESVVTVFPDSSERYLSKGLYGEFEDWEGKA